MGSNFILLFNLVVVIYFIVLNTMYLFLFIVAFFESIRYVNWKRIVDLTEVFRSPLTPSISLLMPAYNEEHSIIESVRAVLLLHYPQFEVVVINDGSSDHTLGVLIQEFELDRITKVVPSKVPCEEICGVYISREYDNLIVVDKKNGGKSDALNAGINVSRHELVCVIDADTMIEPDGLLKIARPFMEDPLRTVAAGGLVRIINGCTVDSGVITRVKLPRNYFANIQIVEYLRAFLGARVGWSVLRCLLIISGAFGLFKRDAVISVGGYRRDTVGEDLDLVVRLHKHLIEEKKNYRVYFVPDPVCWTEVPEKFTQLSRQRDRWQRGLMESLVNNIQMLLNPRYGRIGLIAMPFFFFFDMLGPLIELLGLVAVVFAYIYGIINIEFFMMFISVAVIYSIIISLFAVYLEGIAFQRYVSIRSLLQLTFFAVLENIGYRQIHCWWRAKAYVTYFTRRKKWGEIKHAGYGGQEEIPLESLAAGPAVEKTRTRTIMTSEFAVNDDTMEEPEEVPVEVPAATGDKSKGKPPPEEPSREPDEYKEQRENRREELSAWLRERSLRDEVDSGTIPAFDEDIDAEGPYDAGASWERREELSTWLHDRKADRGK